MILKDFQIYNTGTNSITIHIFRSHWIFTCLYYLRRVYYSLFCKKTECCSYAFLNFLKLVSNVLHVCELMNCKSN